MTTSPDHLLTTAIEDAARHGRESDPDHEVGDLQCFARLLWERVPAAARAELAAGWHAWDADPTSPTPARPSPSDTSEVPTPTCPQCGNNGDRAHLTIPAGATGVVLAVEEEHFSILLDDPWRALAAEWDGEVQCATREVCRVVRDVGLGYRVGDRAVDAHEWQVLTTPRNPTLDSEMRAYAHSWHVAMNEHYPGEQSYVEALSVVEDNLDVAIELAANVGVTITEDEAAAWIDREVALNSDAEGE